jgi:hypothetical protein
VDYIPLTRAGDQWRASRDGVDCIRSTGFWGPVAGEFMSTRYGGVDCIHLALFGDWRASSCEYNSNISGLIKDGKFLEFTRNSQSFKNDCGPWVHHN